jgi:hypothetical protein
MFGANLKAYAASTGLTVNGLGKDISDKVKEYPLIFQKARISPAAVARWCKGFLPDAPQLIALCIYIGYRTDLRRIGPGSINTALVNDVKEDLTKLSPEEFSKKHGFILRGGRWFIYSLYSQAIATERHGRRVPAGIIGSFSIQGTGLDRAIRDGNAFYGFLTEPKRTFRGRWISKSVVDIADWIGVIFDFVDVPGLPSPRGTRGITGALMMECMKRGRVVGEKAFSGFFVDFPERQGRYAGVIYAEECSGDDFHNVVASMDSHVSGMTTAAREIYTVKRDIS